MNQLNSKEIAEQQKKLQADLSAPFPEKAEQRTKSSETRRGYDTSGYGYQWVVDRMNEVLGIHGWNTEILETRLVEGETAKGRLMYTAIIHLRLQFLDMPAVGCHATRECFGWHKSLELGDALKGAFTNALKKTAALFGIGADAYRGEMDDDNRPVPEARERKAKGRKSKQRGNTEPPMPNDQNAPQSGYTHEPFKERQNKALDEISQASKVLGPDVCKKLVGSLEGDSFEMFEIKAKILRGALDDLSEGGRTSLGVTSLVQLRRLTNAIRDCDGWETDCKDTYNVKSVEEMEPLMIESSYARYRLILNQQKDQADSSSPDSQDVPM